MMSDGMAIFIIVLNCILFPLGTLVSACADQRGFNPKLLLMFFLHSIPYLALETIASQMNTLINKLDVSNDAQVEQLKSLANWIYIFSVLCFVAWIHGISNSCRILQLNQQRIA